MNETTYNTNAEKDAILKGLYKPVAQPYAQTFADVFEDWKPRDVMKSNEPHPFPPRHITGQNIAGNLYNDVKSIIRGEKRSKHNDESMAVGPFCSVSSEKGYRFFSVSCADWVLSRIRERTIIIGGDTMSFEVIDHRNGWSLVTAHHGQILGSVWLAYIRTDSVPKT
jgi:hypothetical protein